MGVEIRTIRNTNFSTPEMVADELSRWLMQEHNFALKRKEIEGGKYIITVNKSGLLRQISGLVFEYKVEIHTTDSYLVATVDDGDLRKQLAALGMAWFFAWPALLTAGYGMIASGQFRQEILGRIEHLVTA